MRRPSRRAAWHLAWAEPLGLLVALVCFVIASFSHCGFNACHGDDRGPLGPTMLAIAFASASVAGPVALVPWGALRTRLAAATVVFMVAAAITAAAVFAPG